VKEWLAEHLPVPPPPPRRITSPSDWDSAFAEHDEWLAALARQHDRCAVIRQLGKLAARLQRVEPRYGPKFKLGQEQRRWLILELWRTGVDRKAICWMTGASRSAVYELTPEKVPSSQPPARKRVKTPRNHGGKPSRNRHPKPSALGGRYADGVAA
jgi:hypothetical protein